MEIKTTFSGQTKELLENTKIDKSCCKQAYVYGKELFRQSEFTYFERSYLKCNACHGHLLRGIFVSIGAVSSPEKSHHLEFKTKSKPEADELIIILTECGFKPGLSKRGNYYRVYFKDGETIFGFLSYIGAGKYAFDFLDVMIEKQIRNDCNRKTNFDAANMQKSASTGVKQAEAVKYLMKKSLLDGLSEKIIETAMLRYENPSANLNELAELHVPPVTKSCVNHRLAKITEYYEKCSKKKI